MTSPSDAIDLGAIEARLDTATPGPWRWVAVAGGWDGVAAEGGPDICRLSLNLGANAILIAHAPEDLRALLGEARRLAAIRAYLDAVSTQPTREDYPEWSAIADDDRQRLQSWGARACQAGIDAAEEGDADDALAESLEACQILGIDTSGDYDYLGTLRAVVAERDAAKAALTATGLDYGRGLVHGFQALDQQIRVDRGIINLFDRNRRRTLAALAAAGVTAEDTDTGVATLAAERDEARRDAARCEARLAGGAS